MAFVPGLFPGERVNSPERGVRNQLLGLLSLKSVAVDPPLHQSEHYDRDHFVPKPFEDGTGEEWAEANETWGTLPENPDVVEGQH